jgi:hypothetical protein
MFLGSITREHQLKNGKKKNKKIQTPTADNHAYKYGEWNTRIPCINLLEGFFVLKPSTPIDKLMLIKRRSQKLAVRCGYNKLLKYPLPTEYEINFMDSIQKQTNAIGAQVNSALDEICLSKKQSDAYYHKKYKTYFKLICTIETSFSILIDYIYLRDAYYPWRHISSCTNHSPFIGQCVAVGGYKNGLPAVHSLVTDLSKHEEKPVDFLFYAKFEKDNMLLPFLSPEKIKTGLQDRTMTVNDLVLKPTNRIVRLLTPFEKVQLIDFVKKDEKQIANLIGMDTESFKQKLLNDIAMTWVLQTDEHLETNIMFINNGNCF